MPLKKHIRSFLRSIRQRRKNRKSQKRKDLIGAQVIGLLVATEQGKYLVDPQDVGVGGALIKQGTYGKAEIARIKTLTTSASRVLFVGAHIGALAIPVSKFVKEVVAFEANPHTFRLLSLNLLLNEANNVRAVELAASDTKGEIDLVLSKHNSGGSKRMPIIKEQMYFQDNPQVRKVSADRLDDVLSDNFDLIVMDIEGSEFFALKGMSRLLSVANHLIVEFLPHHIRNVANTTLVEFLDVIDPYFSSVFIPSKNIQSQKPEYRNVLSNMYSENKGDDGVVFSKKWCQTTINPRGLETPLPHRD